MKIFLLHSGKANYPEIEAYTEYFSHRHTIRNGNLSALNELIDRDEYIVWCIMGFYPEKLYAKRVIHDYRSLSVGRFSLIKDQIKRIRNSTPDLRIFQNEEMRRQMNFKDKVPFVLLPMGVPGWMFEMQEAAKVYDYCYIGEMSLERKFDKLLDAFCEGNNNKSLILVGSPESKILEKYSSVSNIIFTGRLPQREALEIVLKSRVAVSYFPYHRPHKFQYPTKLLEYAALGAAILCNDSPGNVLASKEFGIQSAVSSRYIFDQAIAWDFPADKFNNVRENMLSCRWNEILDKVVPEINDCLSVDL